MVVMMSNTDDELDKIYSSTEYIEDKKVGDLKLEVIGQWDFKSQAVCYETIKSMGGSNLLIPYKLNRTIHVDEDKKGWKVETVESLTKEMARQLEKMGCALASRFKEISNE